MELKNLTSDERAELKAQLAAEEAADKQRIQQSRDDYKNLVDEFVRANISKLRSLSEQMQAIKLDVFADAQTGLPNEFCRVS